MDEVSKMNAMTVYKTVCGALDDRHWRYEEFPDDFVVRFRVVGEDIPMDFIIKVDEQRDLVRMLSSLPFAFGEKTRLDGAIALSQINYKLADGSFDYNYKTGEGAFRLTSSYRESLISKTVIAYMIDCACFTVDRYNDKLLMLDKGVISLEDFLGSL